MNIETELRNCVDDLAAPVEIGEIWNTELDSYVREGQSRLAGRRRLIVAIAAAALAVTSTAGLLITSQGDASTSDDIDLELSRLGGLSGRWALIEDAGKAFAPAAPSGRVFIKSMVRLQSGFYAVGEELRVEGKQGALWRSADGISWARSPVDFHAGVRRGPGLDLASEGMSLRAIAEREGDLMMVGEAFDTEGLAHRTVLFRSTDGHTWDQVEFESANEANVEINALLAVDSGFVLLGYDLTNPDRGFGSRVVVMRSADGTVWQEVTPRGVDENVRFHDATIVDGRIIAVGRLGLFTATTTQAAVWISDDSGITWTQTTDSDVDDSVLVGIAAGPRGILAVGWAPASGQQPISQDQTLGAGESGLILWYSIDGVEWNRSDPVKVSSAYSLPHGPVWGPSGFLVVATQISPDGVSSLAWKTVEPNDVVPVELAPGMGPSFGVVATPGGYVLLADEPLPTPDRWGNDALTPKHVWLSD